MFERTAASVFIEGIDYVIDGVFLVERGKVRDFEGEHGGIRFQF